MSLQPGDRVGPYEILSTVGAGGMGVVYRSRDTRLDRTVAVKVLPDAVAHDPERLARFEREAKMLAALNHPHIAQIYGVEGPALAMEFVEGEDLSARIARGPIPVDEAIDIAQGIALALEAAHELGIIHRDLKASNIRLRPDGAVKVLDFGLAKALAPPSTLVESVSAPTITTPAMTRQNVVLGTAAYMSPEQARGKPVDKRADIWAFGVVLYEMVTGRRPFEGETVSDSLAAALKSEPDWTPVPVQLRRLLRSCLEKDPRKRLRDIGDWRRQLDDPAALTPAPAVTRAWLPWSLSAVLALVAGALAFVQLRESPPEPVSFQIPPPAKSTFETFIAMSPDGRRIAFTARDADGLVRVWVRDFAALEARPIAGTEDVRSIAWSPDGRSIAFVAGRSLKRTGLEIGPVLTIYEGESLDEMGSAAWSQHGVLVIGGFRTGGMRLVRETGGQVSALTTPDLPSGDLAHGIPAFLPDGRHFVYIRVGTDPAAAGLFLGSIDKTPEEQQQTRLLPTSNAVFTTMSPVGDALLYLRQSTLVAHPFDAEGLALAGEPVPIAEGVGNSGALGLFSAAGGVVAFRSGARASGGRMTQLTWLDRNGQTTGLVSSPSAYDGVWLAPDGARAAVIQVGLSDTGLGNIDVWLVDLARSVSQRLTSSTAVDRWPVWSPRGDRIVFNSGRAGQLDLYVTTSSGAGAEELLFKSDVAKTATSWSRDGRFLLFNSLNPETGSDIFVLPLEGDRQPVPIVQSTFAESGARFSADAKWIVYTSDMSGRSEIYVRPFDPAAPASAPGGPTIVSRDGGRLPTWRRDGREVIFESLGGTLMSVDIVLDAAQIRPGVPKPLFTLPPGVFWDVTDDGQRFLVTMPTIESGLTPITVMLNWTAR
jgi:serine/threonine protein kinase/Tol biopolymer transport system component